MIGRDYHFGTGSMATFKSVVAMLLEFLPLAQVGSGGLRAVTVMLYQLTLGIVISRK